ncbi:hypothetical protein [Actinoallomurus sp. CA-150999]|uniref:hypothetical protein n=1 Tax=Actinoallomurus sp. CA-150999 TaxID=3239887 RepID=UPI003D8C90FC
MSERQDRPEGRHALPTDRPVAGMPSDDAVEGRVVGSSSGERTGRPGAATAGPAEGAIVPPQPGPVTDTGGPAPLPRRTRERDEDGSPGRPPGGRSGASAPRTDVPGAGGPGEARTAGPGTGDPNTTRPDGPGMGGPGDAHTAGPGTGSPGEARTAGPGMGGSGEARTAAERLLGRGDAARFDSRWHEVKAGFVDDPRDSVRQARSLCEEAVRALTAALDEQRRSLEQRWQGDDADTERLRLALRAYGDLLQRLVTL